jgi:hypothetical protein
VVTVTASSPMVDTTTAVPHRGLDREAIDQIPTGRTIQGLAQLDRRRQLEPARHRRRPRHAADLHEHARHVAANNTVMVDGMLVNGLQLDGGVQSYFNDAMNQEVSYSDERHRRRHGRRRRAAEHDSRARAATASAATSRRPCAG